MNSNNQYPNTQTVKINLIGEYQHRLFIAEQAAYGFAQRGGVNFPYATLTHSKRLVSDVNILSSKEKKQLIFSESIFSN